MRRFLLLIVFLTAASAAFVTVFYFRSENPTTLYDSARQFAARGDFAAAEDRARRALAADASFGDAALLAAECARELRQFRRALAYLKSRSEPAAQLLAARILRFDLLDFHAAEAAYRAALKQLSEDPAANDELARLLILCGRRREAIPFVLKLVALGEETDLLVILARADGTIVDRDALNRAQRDHPGDPNPVLGLARYAILEENHQAAIPLLQQAVSKDVELPAAWAALGQQLAAAGRFNEVARWAESLPDPAKEFPDTWMAMGAAAEHDNDPAGAIRSYWEALRREPESREAHQRLSRLLIERGDNDRAQVFLVRLGLFVEFEDARNRALYSGRQAGVDELLALVGAFVNLGRYWEAYGWGRIAVDLRPDDPRLTTLWPGIVQTVKSAPLQLTVPASNPAIVVDLSDYPLPQFQFQSNSGDASGRVSLAPVTFRADGPNVGFAFRFDNAARDKPFNLMYEFTGGGIGVLDFDLDGWPDLFCTQAGSPPFQSPSLKSDALFHNRSGKRFENVSVPAGVREAEFGQGVAVGDVDSDGFPDVYVANIGGNVLWRNNGDGTFAPSLLNLPDRSWTTSCLMADVNGDRWPDLYDVNYLTGPHVFTQTCRNSDGSTAMCMPFDFDAAPDRLWLGDGSGGFRDATTQTAVEPKGKGLGIAAWDADGSGRLTIFVANDTQNNFLFQPDAESKEFRLEDRGILAGIAFNESGKPEGSMGVALRDLDADGRLEVYVTNFLAESNTLYWALPNGLYADRTREVGLDAPTLSALGFGTQFLDADLDGRAELFVANGHIQDLERFGKPYRMRPQLFRWNDRSFNESAPAETGGYFEDRWLARAAARIDWNRDGREDLVIGHLADDSALLTNTSPKPGNWLSLRLFGVASDRDAIGAAVTIHCGDRTTIRQITAGDGYQAANERILIFGLGNADAVDELSVHWPSGAVQTFNNLAAPARLALTEGGVLLKLPEQN